jgi:hypothetical protein
MIDNSQNENEEMLIAMINPQKVVEHFEGDISEIRNWADMSSKEELLVTIKAFQRDGMTDYIDTLLESLNKK